MSELLEIIRQVPGGYDPFRDAGEEYVFCEARALDALGFVVDYIVHIEGEGLEGTPYLLEPHEVCIITNLFGWIDPVTGYRRYKELFFYVPRKNSKTTLAAAIAAIVLFTDVAWRMQMYSCGADLDQAAVGYDILCAMIEANPELSERVRIFGNRQGIVLRADGSKFRPLSSKAKSKHGKNTHFVLYDEIHAYPNGELIEAISTSMATRRQGLEVYTTTADHEGESICNEKYEEACMVRDGINPDPCLLPFIYEVPPQVIKDDPDYWTKEEWWRHCNPLYGKSVQRSYFQRLVAKAKRNPHLKNSFLRLHLNVQTSSSERMIDAEKWALNDGDYHRDEFKGMVADGAAIDLGMTSDMCSLCLLYGNSAEGFRAIWWHWIPRKAALEYQETKQIPYELWAEGGWVKITEGDEIDYDLIRDDLIAINEAWPIAELAVDRLFQGAQLCQQLAKLKWTIFEFGQGYYSMAAPTASFLGFVNRGKWGHGNSPIMKFQAQNAVAERNVNEDIKPSKKKSVSKIDGIVTGIMATGMAIREVVEEGHAYQNRGMLKLEAPNPRRGAPKVRDNDDLVTFRITREELEELEEAENTMIAIADLLRRYGFESDDYRTNPNDQREFTAWPLLER